MVKTTVAFIFITVFLTLLQPIDSYAHPGRTASDGCHYCRTNCAKWGEVEGARHCHSGYTAPAPTNNTYSPPKPTCPANSTYNSVSNDCTCKSGYVTSLSKTACVKIPFNAHAVISTTEVWECDAGYTEVGDVCEKIKPPEIIDESTGSVEGAETDSEVKAESQTPMPASSQEISSSEDENNGLLGMVGMGLVILGTLWGINSYNKSKVSDKV